MEEFNLDEVKCEIGELIIERMVLKRRIGHLIKEKEILSKKIEEYSKEKEDGNNS